MVEVIHELLVALQNETPNWGGRYRFNKVELSKQSELRSSLVEYFLLFEKYKNPYLLVHGKKILSQERNIDNLKLEKIENYQEHILGKLAYWSEHRTSLDRFDDPTPQYPAAEEKFKAALFEFLNSLTELESYAITGINTQFAHGIGEDHANDDTLFSCEEGYYVLHFGWSS